MLVGTAAATRKANAVRLKYVEKVYDSGAQQSGLERATGTNIRNITPEYCAGDLPGSDPVRLVGDRPLHHTQYLTEVAAHLEDIAQEQSGRRDGQCRGEKQNVTELHNRFDILANTATQGIVLTVTDNGVSRQIFGRALEKYCH